MKFFFPTLITLKKKSFQTDIYMKLNAAIFEVHSNFFQVGRSIMVNFQKLK